MEQSNKIHLASLEATKFLQLVTQWWQLSNADFQYVDVETLKRSALKQGEALRKSLVEMRKKSPPSASPANAL